MCNDGRFFQNTTKSTERILVSVGDGNQAEVSGIGSITSVVVENGVKRTVQLVDVQRAPNVMCNLIPVRRMRKAGLQVLFNVDDCRTGYCSILSVAKSCEGIATVVEIEKGLYDFIMQPVEQRDQT